MSQKQKSQHTLEFDKILSRLAGFTSFEAGRQLALGLQPAYHQPEIERRLQETAEARDVLRRRPDVSAADARDIRQAAYQASLDGVLDPETLLHVGATLGVARRVRRVLAGAVDWPALADVAARITVFSDIEEEIARCIDPRGQVLDGASPILRRIRAELKVAQARIVDRLNGLIASATGRTALQEPIVTLREGRYVVPVKADYRGQIPGVVHGTSASGATLFVEPLATVELNNEWRELQANEQHEVQRILRALSLQVGAQSERIAQTVDALAEIDLAFAKARFADRLNAVVPALSPDTLDLPGARHPLLTGEVVPIDLRLGGETRCLVITGPNTGGKTVALKTAGLFVLMALSGLAVPAAEGATIPLVSGVYADIGDEQSIEQSLSTFSAHQQNIVRILRDADRRSLVLLDELGAGTDPSEGSALARAILNRLVVVGSMVIATTHYTELKEYAQTTEGVANASVEFDAQSLRPTYRLTIGLPGRSNALAIAARLGLDPEIIEDARSMLSPVQVQTEELLGRIQAERRRAERERRRVAAERAQAERLRRDLDQQIAATQQRRKQILDEAERQAAEEVRRVRAELNELVRQARSTGSQRAGLEEARRRLAEVTGRPAAGQSGTLGLLAPRRTAEYPELGSTVRVRSWGQMGTVLSPLDEDGELEIGIGSFRVRMPLDELDWVRPSGEPNDIEAAPPVPAATVLPSAPPVQYEIDLRGRRVGEVFEDIEQVLNDAELAGQPFLRIVHGKGTGALRQVIRQQLAGHPLVGSFRGGEPGEGGDGATIVFLASAGPTAGGESD